MMSSMYEFQNIMETSSDLPKNEKSMNASLHRLENEIFRGSKNWSPTAYGQYRQAELSEGLSRYPPATFTNSWAQVEQVWLAGGLNNANSSGWHLITRPLQRYVASQTVNNRLNTHRSSVETMAARVRVKGSSWYNHDFQKLIIVGNGMVTPQNIARTRLMKGLNKTAT